MIADWTSYRYTAHPWRVRLSLLFGWLGVATSLATIYAAPAGGASQLSCGLEALDCTKALSSHFAKIGGVPLGVFGVFYFTFWTLNLRAFQMTSNDGYRWFLSWITVAGAVVSLTLAFIMFVIIRAPCGFCLIAHSSNLASFALLWPVRAWRMSTPFTSEQFRHFLAIVAIASLASVCVHLADEVRTLKAEAAAAKRAVW